jgi:hypothetical protein
MGPDAVGCRDIYYSGRGVPVLPDLKASSLFSLILMLHLYSLLRSEMNHVLYVYAPTSSQKSKI